MGKSIVGMAVISILVFCFGGVAGAATTSEKMYDAINKQLKTANYDYADGTLKLENVATEKLDQPVDGIKTIKMAVANYETVRQGIFFISHKEVVYYNPDKNEVVPVSTAGKATVVQDYQKQHSDVAGEHFHLSWVMLILAFLLIIPAFFAYVWQKGHYSVLSYRLESNLLEGVGPSKYR